MAQYGSIDSPIINTSQDKLFMKSKVNGICIILILSILLAIIPNQQGIAAESIGIPKISVKVSGEKIKVKIGKTEGASGYLVYMKKPGEKKYKKIGTVKKDGSAKRTYTFKKLIGGDYSIKVKAYDKDGKKGEYSKIINIHIPIANNIIEEDISADKLTGLLKDAVWECMTSFASDKNFSDVSYNFELSFTSEEKYREAEKAFNVMFNNLFHEGVDYDEKSEDVLYRIIPNTTNYSSMVEIYSEGRTPGRFWTYSPVYGSEGGRDDKSDGYSMLIKLSMNVSDNEWINELKIIADTIKESFDTDEDRLRALNTYMVDRFSYDYKAYEAQWSNPDLGIFLDENKGVCCNYADMTAYVCFMLGIPSVELNAQRYGTSGHTWNLVWVDGAWKMLDVTWNDTEGKSEKYFLVKEISGDDHDWDKDDDVKLVDIAKKKALKIHGK